MKPRTQPLKWASLPAAIQAIGRLRIVKIESRMGITTVVATETKAAPVKSSAMENAVLTPASPTDSLSNASPRVCGISGNGTMLLKSGGAGGGSGRSHAVTSTDRKRLSSVPYFSPEAAALAHPLETPTLTFALFPVSATVLDKVFKVACARRLERSTLTLSCPV